MKNVKAQLRAFYDKQGLTGKHRRKAMQYDMKAVRAHCDTFSQPDSATLACLFLWNHTPQGWHYWSARDMIQ